MTSVSDTPDTPPTPEITTNAEERLVDAFIKERDEALAELKEVKANLASAKKMLKQMQNEQDVRDKALTVKDKGKGSSKKKKKKGENLDVDAAPSLSPSAMLLLSLSTPACRHPKIEGYDPDDDSKEFYSIIAQKFPNLKISYVMEAEKRFLLADKSHDGVIGPDELDRLLIVTVTVFTPGKIQEILKEIDVNESGTIDFLEALTVMEKVMSNKRTNLPDQIKQNQTKICAIQ